MRVGTREVAGVRSSNSPDARSPRVLRRLTRSRDVTKIILASVVSAMKSLPWGNSRNYRQGRQGTIIGVTADTTRVAFFFRFGRCMFGYGCAGKISISALM